MKVTDEFEPEDLGEFIEDLRLGKVMPYMKSLPVPKSQEGQQVLKLVANNYDKEVHRIKKDAVVFFHAPWCGHCKELHKPFLELASMMKKDRQSAAKFKTMESEVMQKCAHSSRFNIDGFPSIVVYRNKTEIGRMVGNQGKDALLAFFTQHA